MTVYIIKYPDRDIIKVGHTDVSVRYRLHAYRQYHGYHVDLLAHLDGGLDLEAELHDALCPWQSAPDYWPHRERFLGIVFPGLVYALKATGHDVAMTKLGEAYLAEQAKHYGKDTIA